MKAHRLLLAGALALSAGCTGSEDEPTPAPADVSYARPWEQRPVVDLRFDLSSGLDTVEGSETVRFTAERRVCGLVFRLWANKPETVAFGSELEVTAASVDGRSVTPHYAAAGAPASTQGSLLRLPLQHCLRPGHGTTATLDFVLRLGEHAAERLGWAPDLAWFGTGFPVLGWQRGRGWATNPVVNQKGETASSEAFRLRSLEVVVPQQYEVVATGERLPRRPGTEPGTAVESFRAPSVRDVAVTVGELTTYELETEGGVRLHVSGPADGTGTALADWAHEADRAIAEISALLGPYPYPDLWLSVIPDCPTGIEFPGAIQFTDLPAGHDAFELLVSHEVAHMWFYSLIGNNQGTSPWLDEALATYVQQVVDDTLTTTPPSIIPAVRGHVGEPMTWYARPEVSLAYAQGVYRQGAAMLAEARTTVGAETFDRLLRDYVAAQAHRIATPDDFAAAFADAAPRAVSVFRSYGAID
ncbi:MAG: hypothetical protein H0V23_13055 [Nocardioidaceae bacterium]|nr:hypothetical protein [Nocardioidaceae bacterium]